MTSSSLRVLRQTTHVHFRDRGSRAPSLGLAPITDQSPLVQESCTSERGCQSHTVFGIMYTAKMGNPTVRNTSYPVGKATPWATSCAAIAASPPAMALA